MNQNELEWVVTRGGRVGTEWDVRKWKSEINRDVKSKGLNEWRNGMERKTTLEWYKVKEAPMVFLGCVFVLYRSSQSKGLALERSRATCSTKIKIKILTKK
ncbi:hypothetical protein E2C01_017706 [Portunus trituberculatus]|uniref:Uncharacterized protein n=1 Tax=Portunus trituberculatus TaxID=210409 RepID=A0A5B7DT88_PORTR|nr:hypothetical protein [Portunus trituberculatus]